MNLTKIDLDDKFSRVLEEKCQDYTILTSIYGFIYRVEIYLNGQLLDGVEVDLGSLATTFEGDTDFAKHYTEAHMDFVRKYCTTQKESHFERIDEKEIDWDSTDSEKYSESTSTFTSVQKKLNKKAIYIGLFTICILLLLLLFRPIACNDSIVSAFIGDDNLLKYHERTESMCHNLESYCKRVANTNLDQLPIGDSEKCRLWCKKGIIGNNRCILFLSLLPKEEEHDQGLYNTLNISTLSPSSTQKKPYTFLPDKKMELTLGVYFPIKILNRSNMNMKVKLYSFTLEKSIHEEIVQFENGNIEIDIAPNKENSFTIYLEPTYYEQFPKREYVGEIIFSIYFSNGKREKKKLLLTFMVK